MQSERDVSLCQEGISKKIPGMTPQSLIGKLTNNFWNAITRIKSMPFSLYQCSIPKFISGLDNLANILTKGAEHTSKRDIDESIFINFRLYPNMLPLSFQVQAATDFVKRGAARMAAIGFPSYEDNETSFADMQTRVEKL